MRYMRINKIYILNDILKNNFYKNKWKLIPNNNSIVYFLKKHQLIIKMYKLIDKEKINSFDTTNFLNISVSEYSKHGYCNSYRELVLLQLMQPLIENNICIHYPILITYTRLDSECLKCQNMLKKKINLLQQKARLRKYLKLQYLSDSNLLIFKEYINYSLKTIFKKQYDDRFWLCMLFQILYTLYINNTKLNMVNFDLHLNNIFFKKIKSGGYLKYYVNNTLYKIPNIGYIFIIVDYGNSISTNFKLSKKELKEYKLLKDVHYDVFSFMINFTLYNIKQYYLSWFHNKNIIKKIKKIDINIYNEAVSNIKQNNYYNIDELLLTELKKLIINKKGVFEKLQSHIHLPSNKFNMIIKKYLCYAKNIKNVSSLPKLDPAYIIKNEFGLYKDKT